VGGFPDVGLLTFTEMLDNARHVINATSLPTLCDVDTGYGNVTNVARTIREFEAVGAAGVHIEDQTFPKRCGQTAGATIVDTAEMQAKIFAAKEAQADDDFVLIVRTDARQCEGFDATIERSRAYIEAGADAIFPEALVNADMFRAFAKAMPGVKLLANMTEFGRTPFFTAGEFEQMGYKMVIWPVSAFRVANKAQAKLYAMLKRDGGAQAMLDQMQTRAELYELIGYHQYEALDASIVETVVPQGMPQR